MEISDGESEDGQITKFEQEEEKAERIFNKPASTESQPITKEDLEKCRLSRNQLLKFALTPWFEDYVKGSLSQSLSLTPNSWICRRMGTILGWKRRKKEGKRISNLRNSEYVINLISVVSPHLSLFKTLRPS